MARTLHAPAARAQGGAFLRGAFRIIRTADAPKTSLAPPRSACPKSARPPALAPASALLATTATRLTEATERLGSPLLVRTGRKGAAEPGNRRGHSAGGMRTPPAIITGPC